MSQNAAVAEAAPKEREWIARATAHADRQAFTALVRLHQSALRAFLRRLVGDPTLADDLAQDAFLRAWKHIGSYRGEGRFLSWLFRIGYQCEVDRRRARGERIDVPLEDDGGAVEFAPERDVDAARLRTLLDRLQPLERSAMHLHFAEDLSFSEVAATLQIPLGTVKTLIRRARIKLQRACGIHPEEHPP
jgi:RNA polymerase sigma-70 factor (ECF subfamily)